MELLILPFGVLPLVLLAAFIVWKAIEATVQGTIINDRRFGTTEFPTEVSRLLFGTNQDELAFSDDGKSVVLTIKKAYREIPDIASAELYVKDNLYRRDDVNADWVDQLAVTHVAQTEQPRGYKLTITMPRSTVLSMNYIENEIKNLGCVFVRNTFNKHRYLYYPQNTQRIETSNGRLLVHIHRIQLVQGFFDDSKELVMSERQITRNIRNRLWNQVDVKCISIDRQTYCGEIVYRASN